MDKLKPWKKLLIERACREHWIEGGNLGDIIEKTRRESIKKALKLSYELRDETKEKLQVCDKILMSLSAKVKSSAEIVEDNKNSKWVEANSSILLDRVHRVKNLVEQINDFRLTLLCTLEFSENKIKEYMSLL